MIGKFFCMKSSFSSFNILSISFLYCSSEYSWFNLSKNSFSALAILSFSDIFCFFFDVWLLSFCTVFTLGSNFIAPLDEWYSDKMRFEGCSGAGGRGSESFFLERLIRGGIVILLLDFFCLLEEYEHLLLRRLFFSVKSFLSFGFAERFMIFSPIFSFSDFCSIDGIVELFFKDSISGLFTGFSCGGEGFFCWIGFFWRFGRICLGLFPDNDIVVSLEIKILVLLFSSCANILFIIYKFLILIHYILYVIYS